MNRTAAYRGQPLMVLLVLLAGWLALRVVLWQSPFAEPVAALAEPLERVVAPLVETVPQSLPQLPVEPRFEPPPAPAPPEPLRLEPATPLPAEPLPAPWAFAAEPAPARTAELTPRVAGGHVLLLAAAFSGLPVPPELAALVPRGRATPADIAPFPSLAGDTTRPALQRWSGDAWLLLRRDTATPVTSGRGSYGRSQLGSVLRYRLAPTSGHRPAAYVRSSMALAGPREAEAALGVSARPLPRVPFVLAAELRAARFGERVEARPAAFAYTEFPPLKLPLGVRGEAYFQGGYVGGDHATAFVDGQVRVEREVARIGPAGLSAGAGAWGGAQKGARRLDVGPGAAVTIELGGAPVRMSADWRFRVAGEAEPSSGPALTVSAGF